MTVVLAMAMRVVCAGLMVDDRDGLLSGFRCLCRLIGRLFGQVGFAADLAAAMIHRLHAANAQVGMLAKF